MRVEVITSEPVLRALCPEWSELLDRCPYATPFQSPEWLLPWWRHFGSGSLRVVAARTADTLVGLFPLYVENGRILLIGSGITDYLDVLVDPAFEHDALAAMFGVLLQCKGDWETAQFGELRPASPLLNAAIPGELVSFSSAASVCPFLTLPGTPDDFYAALSYRQRRHIRSAKKKASETYLLELSLAQSRTLPAYLDDLFRLHNSRWNERNLPGVLSDEAIQRFHRDAMEGFLDKGWLYLYGLKFDGVTVASIYAIRRNERLFGYLGGFDPAHHRFSPGMLALSLVFEDAICKGVQEFDFLRGREAYKYAWGAHDRTTYALTLSRS
jgi:CelD/BcsL family acetyltransferase involved in cellulose biosynthesis